MQKWPGLPRGVKFDPSDEDLPWHLLGKIGKGKAMPHPFIYMFVTSLDDDVMIGHTHPDLLPGKNPKYLLYLITIISPYIVSQTLLCTRNQAGWKAILFLPQNTQVSV